MAVIRDKYALKHSMTKHCANSFNGGLDLQHLHHLSSSVFRFTSALWNCFSIPRCYPLLVASRLFADMVSGSRISVQGYNLLECLRKNTCADIWLNGGTAPRQLWVACLPACASRSPTSGGRLTVAANARHLLAHKWHPKTCMRRANNKNPF